MSGTGSREGPEVSGTTALIGVTGFVGGTLARTLPVDAGYHSRNIETIAGRRYDLIVCAGAPAEKWRANQQPEADRATIQRLIDALATVEARRVVLISTVDVFGTPSGVDEDTPVDRAAATPYGRHRYDLERSVAGRFRHTILRLPALFGPGLKKNLVFDLLHGRASDGVALDSVFQWYDVTRLADDLRRAVAADLALAHLAVEGIPVRQMAAEAFGLALPERAATPVHYDMQTRHAAVFGGRRRYLEDATTVQARLRRFVEASGWTRP